MSLHLTPLRFVAVALAGWLSQQQQDVIEYLHAENRVLREQIGNRRLRLNDQQRRRLAVRAKKLGHKLLGEVASIVTPDTLLSWHRKLIARKYDGSKRRSPGRPPVMEQIRSLVVCMATENRDWGYTRIRGALANLGHQVARGTIANILKQHGIEPAPERLKKTTWREFLQAHWEVLAAADFFTVEVWTRSGLVRVVVLFLIDLSTRRVEVAGITTQPDGVWITQIARNLTDDVDGFLVGNKYLIHDRDPLFTREFVEALATAGVRTVRLPARSPNLNAYAERFVRSIKESCLNRMILFGERSLRRATREFLTHYHFERNHQGLDNQLIFPETSAAKPGATIECRQRLGGMLKYYHQKVA